MIDNASNMNVTDLCYFFKQCTNGVSPAVKALMASRYRIFAPSSQNSNVSIPFVCPVCEMLLKKAIDLVLNNRSEAAIVWALEEVMLNLPIPIPTLILLYLHFRPVTCCRLMHKRHAFSVLTPTRI